MKINNKYTEQLRKEAISIGLFKNKYYVIDPFTAWIDLMPEKEKIARLKHIVSTFPDVNYKGKDKIEIDIISYLYKYILTNKIG